MTEREPMPTAATASTEAITRPPYEQIGQGLERLLTSVGGTVVEGFPRFGPKGAMTDYDHATKTLILHPWISPRAKSEALLRETVRRLSEKQGKKRGKNAPEARSWVVESTVAGHFGLSAQEDGPEEIEPTVFERSLVDHIIGSIEGERVASEPAAATADGDGQGETVCATPTPKRTRVRKEASAAGS